MDIKTYNYEDLIETFAKTFVKKLSNKNFNVNPELPDITKINKTDFDEYQQLLNLSSNGFGKRLGKMETKKNINTKLKGLQQELKDFDNKKTKLGTDELNKLKKTLNDKIEKLKNLQNKLNDSTDVENALKKMEVNIFTNMDTGLKRKKFFIGFKEINFNKLTGSKYNLNMEDFRNAMKKAEFNQDLAKKFKGQMDGVKTKLNQMNETTYFLRKIVTFGFIGVIGVLAVVGTINAFNIADEREKQCKKHHHYYEIISKRCRRKNPQGLDCKDDTDCCFSGDLDGMPKTNYYMKCKDIDEENPDPEKSKICKVWNSDYEDCSKKDTVYGKACEDVNDIQQCSAKIAERENAIKKLHAEWYGDSDANADANAITDYCEDNCDCKFTFLNEQYYNVCKEDINGIRKCLAPDEFGRKCNPGHNMVRYDFGKIACKGDCTTNPDEGFSNTTPSGSPSSGPKAVEDYSLQDIIEKITDVLRQIQRSIKEEKFKNEKNKLEKLFIDNLNFYERKTQFTVDDILRYMNIPTNYYEATLEQVVIMNSITSNNDIEEEEKLNSILIAREMYRRFNAEEKDKFLKLSEEDQMELVETFLNSVNDNMENNSNNEENKPNNDEKPVDGVIIKEKTFIQKYLIFIIIGAVLFFLLIIFFIFSGKSNDNNLDF